VKDLRFREVLHTLRAGKRPSPYVIACPQGREEAEARDQADLVSESAEALYEHPR
jgi:hypothetical protein